MDRGSRCNLDRRAPFQTVVRCRSQAGPDIFATAHIHGFCICNISAMPHKCAASTKVAFLFLKLLLVDLAARVAFFKDVQSRLGMRG